MIPDAEKDIANLDQVESVDDDDDQITAAEAKSIMRRVDIRLVGVTALGYSVCLMDRANISMAAIAGYVGAFVHTESWSQQLTN